MGTPAEKLRHRPDGTRAPSKFVQRPKLVEEYYDGMPQTDIVNRNAQHLLAIEEAIRTSSFKHRIVCSILGTWVSNSWSMGRKWGRHQQMSLSEFTRKIILGGLFVTVGNGGPVGAPEGGDAGMRQRNAFLENNIVQNIDEQAIDPFVHTMQKLSEVEGGSRQQRCVMCIADGVKPATYTSYYCGLCVITAVRENERRPSKHAYCINVDRQCFTRHVASCYKHMNEQGTVAQRHNARRKTNVTIAGPVILRGPPKRRRMMRKRKRTFI